MAVDKDVAIPISNVVANPLMGPVPKANKINAVNPVVIFASKIDESVTFLNPSETACFCPLPFGKFFANTLKNKHIGINGHTNSKNYTGNTR